MVQYYGVAVKIFILTFVICPTKAFNFSPQPNLVLKESTNKDRSSYFGFTISLRQSSVIIGAPRAQSTLKSQQNINEPGAIYKCSLTGTCTPYVFDNNGNINATTNDYIYDSEKKDNQWLGASIDGGTKDTDKLVVCAPRLIADLASNYLMHGVCYWTPDTLSDRPQNVKKIAPLRLRKNQIKEINGKWHYHHQFGEQGISVHVTENNKEILIGAPGILNWRGSVIRYFMKSDNINYTTEVPNPPTWNHPNDLYFGYSVSSGRFDGSQPNKTFYLASAPQANEQSGEAYIFDIVKASNGEYIIKKYYTFHGPQLGEGYGYAVLAEDLNGDGLTDVIITAPLYSSAGNVDQGVFYVYINKAKFVFELQKKIVSPINGKGRFGSSIAKLSDINHDGYNDIAIGAPFADNGAVFIYLGSSQGIREVHSQKLTAVPVLTAWGPQMFGHGLSKGSDIDSNGFNDLAIGAPNVDSVYVYRAYPIVKIIATMNSLSHEIKPDETKFQIEICYMISTTSKKIQDQDIAIRVNVDPQVKRVTLQQTNSGELVFNATAVTQNQCQVLDATVRISMAHVFKPIELEMHYGLINGVPNSADFCDKCAAVDPAEPKVNVEKIVFSTGCKTDICVADLQVTSIGLTSTHILGSSRTINVTYDVPNSGETAYLPQINITSSNKMPFAKIPSSCNQHGSVLLCDLNRGQPMTVGSRGNITIVYDVSEIEGTSITLTAAVFSAGKEQNSTDNKVEDVIALQEFTEIEAVSKLHTSHIKLEEEFNSAEIINNYEIKSYGLSRIQELIIAFEIPIAYKFSGSNVTVPILDVNNITVEGDYNHQLLAVEIYQNEATEISMSSVRVQNEMAKNESQYLFTKNIIENLPTNRTILFNCTDPETTICARAVLKVYNFLPYMPVNITIKYHVEFNKIPFEPWENFVIITRLDIIKAGDEDGKSINITRKIEPNILSKYKVHKVPIWVIILAAVGGLLVLATIVYGLYKANFFERKMKEKLEKLVSEPAQHTALNTEDDGIKDVMKLEELNSNAQST